MLWGCKTCMTRMLTSAAVQQKLSAGSSRLLISRAQTNIYSKGMQSPFESKNVCQLCTAPKQNRPKSKRRSPRNVPISAANTSDNSRTHLKGKQKILKGIVFNETCLAKNWGFRFQKGAGKRSNWGSRVSAGTCLVTAQ
ncbi:hypothetical protein NPIL_215211 [Nephila pilipes]|uniref:Uncharacterized protein n=1 Tax=Nephila pilipes TaxID=299642 RepID=A0A8X6P082_NEPPI|nr:hypothetical protein NPIL_215211 [Nephila pilipes]